MKKRYRVLGLLIMLCIVSLSIITQDKEVTADVYYEDVEQFPESYHTALYALKEKHPNWVFEMYDTGLDWDVVVYNEMNPAYRSLLPSYFSSTFVGEVYGDGWSCATKKAVEYYLDPRNWLNDNYIFQFELLTYNAKHQGLAVVKKVLANSFMSGYIEGYEDIGLTYVQAFHDIGKYLGVSPVHLASRVFQEQGVKGDSELISGTYPGYAGYYNYFNIQASGSTREEIVVNGLNEAVSEGWNNRYAALLGGSTKISEKYVLRGQDTLYLQKFDVDPTYDGRYWHQYMQNLAAPSNEGYKNMKAYRDAGVLESSFVFKIPVYRNMPQIYTGSVAEDTYIISSALNDNLVLGIAGASTVNKGNVELQSLTLGANQQFTLKKDTDGYYKIINVNSGMAVDVYKSGNADGTNVQQWSSNSNSSQQWMLADAGDGYYYIISVCNEKYMDVAGGNAQSGANIQMYSKLDTKRQKFKLTPVNEMASLDMANIEAGTYVISSAANSELVLGIQNSSVANGGNLNLQNNQGTKNQQFTIERDSEGYYIIKAVSSGLALDVYKSGQKNKTNIQQWKRNTNASQQWKIYDAGDGYYYFISRCNGKYVSIADNTALANQNVYCYDGNSYITQKFALSKVADVNSSKVDFESGTYSITLASNRLRSIEITGNSNKNKANVAVGTYKSSNMNQQFVIEKNNSGSYSITAVNSGKRFDVYKSGKVNGTNVQQWEANNNSSQRWSFVEAGDGYYYIVSECNGLVLNANGNNIETRLATGLQSQKFKITKLSESTLVVGEPVEIEEGTYTINSMLNKNMVVAVQDASLEDKGNINLEKYTGATSQQFVIEKDKDGYYTIRSVNSAKAVDVYKSGKANKTNVQQWRTNSNASQRWQFCYGGNGSYYIASKCNDLYLHVAGNRAVQNANIQMYKFSNTYAEKFTLNKISDDKLYVGDKISVSEGTYKLSLASDDTIAVAVANLSTANKANILLETYSGNDNQLFVIETNSAGYYTISNVNSGSRLDVYKSGSSEGTNVQQWSANNNASQQWYFEYAGNGNYRIVSKCNNMYLSGASKAAGANVQMTSNTANEIVFKLTKISDTKIVAGAKVEINEGTYIISNVADSTKVIGIAKKSLKNKGNVELQDFTGDNSQKFTVTKLADGSYKLINVNSGCALDVYKSGKTNGTNVQQWSSNNNVSQKWEFYYAGNGSYYIISKCNNLCIDITGGQISAGTNIQTYENNGSQAQKFKLIVQ